MCRKVDFMEKRAFCTECRKFVEYQIEECNVEREVKGKSYSFFIKVAYCTECHSEIFLDELVDENEQRFDEIYRKSNNLITIREIQDILMLYDVEKRPLSKLLGFGELTISRYLEGQLPSKRYSDILLNILKDSDCMKEYLHKGKENITDLACRKIETKLEYMDKYRKNTTKIEKVASYIVNSAYDVTNLALQKILYYIQGCSIVVRGDVIFRENCEAWIHGPVYPDIYEKYKEFGREPIECPLQQSMELDLEEDLELIKEVVDLFGKYNGKYLEYLTHKEEPWISARKGYDEWQSSNEVISIESIEKYFSKVAKLYGIKTVKQMQIYIDKMMN